jgi:hypothetical protein
MIPIGIIAQGGATVPGAPTSFSATPSSNSVSLSWAAPTFNGGLPITSYLLKRGATTIYSGSGTSYNDTGLSPVTGYSYTVLATNSLGDGSTASVSTTTLAGVPSAVTISSTSSTYNSVTLNWTAPSNNGAAITGYSYQQSTDNVNWGTATSAGTGTAVTLTGRSPAVTYYYRMSATNSAGTGSYGSSVSRATPKADTAINAASAGPLAGGLSGTSIPDTYPWYVAVTGLRRTDGTILSGKTLQVQFNLLGGGTWYNLGGATMVTDGSGNAQRNIWWQPGFGSPSDGTTYTSGYNGASATGATISQVGWPEIYENRWRVVFSEDSTELGVTSAASGILDTYYPGS